MRKVDSSYPKRHAARRIADKAYLWVATRFIDWIDELSRKAPKIGLRARLQLIVLALVVLFTTNVLISALGSFARSEALIHYRYSASASNLTYDLELLLKAQKRKLLVLDALGTKSFDRMTISEQVQTQEDQTRIIDALGDLGRFTEYQTETEYRSLFKAVSDLQAILSEIYEDRGSHGGDSYELALASYELALEALDVFSLNNAKLSADRSRVANEQATLIDRIAFLMFLASIVITTLFILALIKNTNQSLSRLKLGVERFGTGDLKYRIDESLDAGEFAELARTFNKMSSSLDAAIEQLEVRERFIKKVFGRYLSDVVVEEILETPDGLSIGGEVKEITILMSDIRDFTRLSEVLNPQETVLLLNRYLGAMAEIVIEYGGVVDEFLGDGVLAAFGAPISTGADAEAALRCAIAMRDAVETVNKKNRADELPEIKTAIAVNTGQVVVGNIGCEQRAKFGFVGHPVNVTSRIEDCARAGEILISQNTKNSVDSTKYKFSRPRSITVKGVKNVLEVFNVEGMETY